MKLDTLAVHAAGIDAATGAVAPPIHLSTTFARDESNELFSPFIYVREGNPTQSILEAALARLEGGEAALAFASGMAAGAAVLQSLERGDRVVLAEDAYYGYPAIARDYLPRWGIDVALTAADRPEALEAAVTPGTRLVWLETPSNPLMKITDLARGIAVARERGAAVLVDNTFASPALQRPLETGADVVLHSSTKYLGGHSDVQGGALIFRRKDELFAKVEHARKILGAVASPFGSWLVLRGLRTLPVRMERHAANATSVARALERHPAVSAVHYPGLSSDPGHDIARRQMSAFGGMLSFRLRGGKDKALDVIRRVKLFVRATSLGGVESLIEHRQTSEGPGSKSPPELLRLSVGLEHPDDLTEDLMQALG